MKSVILLQHSDVSVFIKIICSYLVPVIAPGNVGSASHTVKPKHCKYFIKISLGFHLMFLFDYYLTFNDLHGILMLYFDPLPRPKNAIPR